MTKNNNNNIIREDVLDKTFVGTVESIVKYGAFIKITDLNTVGLLHISKISENFVKNISDYMNEGDQIRVQVIDIRDNRISLKYLGENN